MEPGVSGQIPKGYQMIHVYISIICLSVGMLINAYCILRHAYALRAVCRQHTEDLQMIKDRFEANLALHQSANDAQKKLLRLLQELNLPPDKL
jgi:hypothetical protein